MTYHNPKVSYDLLAQTTLLTSTSPAQTRGSKLCWHEVDGITEREDIASPSYSVSTDRFRVVHHLMSLRRLHPSFPLAFVSTFRVLTAFYTRAYLFAIATNFTSTISGLPQLASLLSNVSLFFIDSNVQNVFSLTVLSDNSNKSNP